jgi:hypothetical protein
MSSGWSMSALPLKADIRRRNLDVCFVPEADSSNRSKGIPFGHVAARRHAVVGRRVV